MRVWEARDYQRSAKQILQRLRVWARIGEISTDLFPTCMCYLRPVARGVCPCRTRQGAGLLCTHARRFGMARHDRAGSTRNGARWWRVVASVVAPLVALSGGVGGHVVALSGGVGGPGGGHAVATRLPCLPVWMRAVLWHVHTGQTGGHVDAASWRASRQAGRPFAARFVVAVDAGRASFARLCGPWLPGCTLADHPSRFVGGLDTRLCAVSLLAWVILGLLGVSFRAGR